MHIILLKFGDNRSAAPQFMEAHNAWIAKGFADGIFHCVGSLDVGGGFILAIGNEHDVLVRRVKEDPFVANDVVTVEMHEVDVKRTSAELACLA